MIQREQLREIIEILFPVYTDHCSLSEGITGTDLSGVLCRKLVGKGHLPFESPNCRLAYQKYYRVTLFGIRQAYRQK